jgi:uncharacterized RDD family membrane protein YckC
MNEPSAYFVRGDDEAEYGPVDLAELREWVAENRVGLGTNVRPDAADSEWNPWQYYPALVALLAEVRVTGPAEAPLPVTAPLGRRATACCLDLILAFGLAVPPVVALVLLIPPDLLASFMHYSQAVLNGQTPASPYPLWFLALFNGFCFFLPMLYFGGFVAAHGFTPGKSLLHLKVVDAQGRKPGLWQSLMRAFVFMVCVYYFFGIPLFYAFFNPQRRALHDVAAGTYVIER